MTAAEAEDLLMEASTQEKDKPKSFKDAGTGDPTNACKRRDIGVRRSMLFTLKNGYVAKAKENGKLELRDHLL